MSDTQTLAPTEKSKTTWWGIAKFGVAVLGLGLGVTYFIATKDLNGAMGIAGTFGTVAGLGSAVGLMKAQDSKK